MRVGSQHGYIDKTGKLVINPQFDVAGDFHDGRAVVASAGRYGYVDKDSKFVIQPQFNRGGDFSSGLALVAVGPKFGFYR